MKNLLNINSTNIKSFGFTSAFDLLAKTLTFDISALTVFNGSGASSVVGIAFSVIDPSGLEIAGIDFTNPSIDPATDTTFVANLLNGFAVFGWYTITGVIRDADNTDYTIILRKEICQPEGYVQNSYVPAKFSFKSDCNLPQVTISELTPFVYKGKSPLSVTKDGVLTYPPNTLSDLDFNQTPFSIIGSGNVFTGRYTINNISLATYDLEDGATVAISYKLINFECVLTCNNDLEVISCCMIDLQADYERDPFSSTGKAIKTKLDSVSQKFLNAVIRNISGKDASKEVADIAAVLGCDCTCGSNAIEPKAIIQGGVELDNLNIVGADAATVTPNTVGSTVTYTVEVKNILVTNHNNDLSFTITPITNGTSITYAIAININALAQNILDEIASDDDLLAFLKNLVNSTNSGIDLTGLNGGCILSLANCSYTLVEPNNTAKTIISIVIDNVVRNAPGSLLLSNTSAVATWLNGLSLGTFVVTADSGAGTITIASATNPHAVTILNMTTTAGALIRQFSKSCTSLVTFLNAVVTYVCALQSAQVKFGVTGQSVVVYDGSGNPTVTSVDPATTLDTLLTLMLQAQAHLFNNLNAMALNCANVKTLFAESSATLDNINDYVLGTKANNCARISFSDLANQILTAVNTSPTLKALFCSLASTCAAATCADPTSVSATFSSGTLTVGANDIAGATNVLIRYRVLNSGATYTVLTKIPSDFPFAITSLGSAQYEVGVQRICSSGGFSNWVTAQSAPCTAPVSFTVSKSGSNFVVAATLTGSQTKIQVRMTDPNGGVTNVTHDFGAVSGTFNIAIPSGLYGNYTFVGSAICDATSTPVFQSAFSSPVTVNNPNPSINQTFNFINTSSSIDLSVSDLSADSNFIDGSFTIPANNAGSPLVKVENYTGTGLSSMQITILGYAASTAQLIYSLGTINAVITGSGLILTFSGVDLTAARTMQITINP